MTVNIKAVLKQVQTDLLDDGKQVEGRAGEAVVARAIGDGQERGRHLGRRPDYFAAANWPRMAPPGLFLVCTFA
jgi:hypothetical protein